MILRRLNWGRAFYAAAVTVAALAVIHAAQSPTVRQRRELAVREAGLRAEVEALWRRGVDLERARDALKTDPVMIERVARVRLGYARPGEVVHSALAVPTEAHRLFQETPAAEPAHRLQWTRAAREALLPALVLLGVGALLASLFANVSLEPTPMTEACS